MADDINLDKDKARLASLGFKHATGGLSDDEQSEYELLKKKQFAAKQTDQGGQG